MPGSSTPPPSSNQNPPDVTIKKSGTFLLDNRKMTSSNLEEGLRRLKRKNGGKKLDITISPDPGCPIEHVVTVMDIAMRLNINAILATEK